MTDRRQAPRLLLLATLLLAPCAPSSGAGVSLDSPFLPASGSAAAQGKPGLLEFRGMLSSGGETYFNLLESSSKKSAWVRLNEEGGDYVVKSYRVLDRVDTVTVEYQGRTLTLPLKAAKTGKAAPIASASAPALAPPPAPSTAVLNPTPADESRRLEDFRAEIARRRMQRAKQAAEQRKDAQPAPAPAQQSR